MALGHDFVDKLQNRLQQSQTHSQLLEQYFMKPQNGIFIWKDRFYGENVAEDEVNCN